MIKLLIFLLPYGATLHFNWTAPTLNVDGTQLTNLAGYRLYESVDASPPRVIIGISKLLTGVSYKPTIAGSHVFYLTAINTKRAASKPSNTVSVTIDFFIPPLPQPSRTPRL